jgi:hypothetical protein
MKKLIDISLDTLSGVFPFLRYSLEESQESEEVTVSFAVAKFDGFGSKDTKELVIAFTADSARFLKIPLESGKKFMSFGYDSLVQLFVFLVSFFSTYLDISIKQVLHFYFQKNMDWKEFLQFVLESNLIDSTVEHSTVFIYAIGELSFDRQPKRFVWTDYSFNKFSYKVSSDVESLFVISFVLGYVQSVLGHDLLVSNLIEPGDEDVQDAQQEPGAEDGEGMPEGGMGGLGGMGGGPGGGMGDLGDLPGEEGMEGGLGPDGGDLGGPGGDIGLDGGEPLPELGAEAGGEMPLPGEAPGEPEEELRK